MRGSIRKRYEGSWSLILDVGEPGGKRKQRWITFRGTKRKAEARLAELLAAATGGTLVDGSKVTLGAWLTSWVETSIRPSCRPATYTRYVGIIKASICKAPIASLPLQKLRASHLEAYYASLSGTFSPSTLTLHHAILHRALRKAVKDRVLVANPASDLDEKPRRVRDKSAEAQKHFWTATEARAFLAAAKAAGPQPAALFALALDCGARKGELVGLRWADVDLDAATIRIVHQLLRSGEFGPLKAGKPRTITIGAETVALLRAHRAHQAEIKIRNRLYYRDHGLVFAKEWGDLHGRAHTLGGPLQANNLGQREYARVIKAAGVKPIKFHGLRHTCATLLLQAGQPVHVVAERLGHAQVSITYEVYAHVLPDQQKDAAASLAALLHG
jgi:integrase